MKRLNHTSLTKIRQTFGIVLIIAMIVLGRIDWLIGILLVLLLGVEWYSDLYLRIRYGGPISYRFLALNLPSYLDQTHQKDRWSWDIKVVAHDKTQSTYRVRYTDCGGIQGYVELCYDSNGVIRILDTNPAENRSGSTL